jgi:predicted Co/Zn/Cd cation transporter (cation efflux family)
VRVKFLALASIAAFLTSSPSAHAELSVESYLKRNEHKAIKNKVEDYLAGVGRGMYILNAFSQAKVFCPPEKPALNAQNFLQTIDETLERVKKNKGSLSEISDNSVEVVLIVGLMNDYPCPK